MWRDWLVEKSIVMSTPMSNLNLSIVLGFVKTFLFSRHCCLVQTLEAWILKQIQLTSSSSAQGMQKKCYFSFVTIATCLPSKSISPYAFQGPLTWLLEKNGSSRKRSCHWMMGAPPSKMNFMQARLRISFCKAMCFRTGPCVGQAKIKATVVRIFTFLVTWWGFNIV